MKSIIVFLIFLVCSNGYSRAKITILSAPEKVQIRLDSSILGTTPLYDIPVEPGAHIIEAYSPYAGLWNVENVVKKFEVSSKTDTTIKISFQKGVKINSIPYHATLVNENRKIGLTPIVIPFEENRGKEFRLEKKGYQSFRFYLESPESRIYTLDQIQFETTDPEGGSFASNLFKKRMKTKFLFLTGTVATHWLAFYFKNIADDNFEKYQTTASSDQMNKYWDTTQKYDRLSDITLGISYAFLSGLIYTVIWN